MSKINHPIFAPQYIIRGVVLASTSQYRRKLLERLHIPFDIANPEVPEQQQANEPPMDMVRRLAAAKSIAVSANFTDRLVIGSDQLAELDGEILGKPGTVERAREQLGRFSGRAVNFYTAVCLSARGGRSRWQHLDKTVVSFRQLSPRDIQRYVEIEQPFDCAGGFKCEGLGISLFRSITSQDPTALIGLPLIAVSQGLRHYSFEPGVPADGEQ